MMNKGLESELKDIQENLQNDNSLMKLQILLNSKDMSSQIYSTPSSREILCKISNQLKPSLLPTTLYHLIQSTAAKIQCELITGGRVRSLLDISGNFIWTESNSSKIFNSSVENLLRSNIFRIMSKLSVNHLFMKHGKYLLYPKRSRVVTYMLSDSSAVLTSRFTPVIYSKSAGEQQLGVIMETRFARHSLFMQRNEDFAFGINCKNDFRMSPYGIDFQIGVFSPQTPNLEYKNLLSPPTTIPTEEKGFEPLEELRITPFLDKNSSPGPYKKRKIEISEF